MNKFCIQDTGMNLSQFLKISKVTKLKQTANNSFPDITSFERFCFVTAD